MEKAWMKQGLELTVEKNGFCGCFFRGADQCSSVIIRVAGSGLSRRRVISGSKFLVDAGFHVLCLGYYKWGKLGNSLSQIPVDYVEKAIDWIQCHLQKKLEEEGILHSHERLKIGMTGVSQGALYSLLAASLIPEISAVAAASPFDYIHEGHTMLYRRTGHSKHVFHGKELPFTPWRILDTNVMKILVGIIKDKKYGLLRSLRYGYDKNGEDEASRILVENMNAHVLLLSSHDDHCWPAEEAAGRIGDILAATDYPYHVESYVYGNGCHNMGGDMGLTAVERKAMSLLIHFLPNSIEQYIHCVEDSKEKIVEFFHRYL